jgi:intracellular septation protein
MQFVIEFFPLVLFLIAYAVKDIYAALIVLMITMPIGLLVKYLRTRKLDRMYFWSTVFLLVMGAATLYFRNPEFLYWKPTAFYWALAITFLIGMFVGEKTLAQRFLDLSGDLPTDRIQPAEWRLLNAVWVAFFAFMGFANIYVAYNFSETVWVNFKVFGLLALTILFMLAQGIWLMSKFNDDDLKPDAEEEQ